MQVNKPLFPEMRQGLSIRAGAFIRKYGILLNLLIFKVFEFEDRKP